MTYAEVILPLAVDSRFTYIVPDELTDKIGVGYRVIVPLGRGNKSYTTIVTSLSDVKPQVDFELKSIAMVLDDAPSVVHPQIKLWEWIAEYYLCTTGEVFKAALPSGLKIESETTVEINADETDGSDYDALGEREKLVLDTLAGKGKISVGEIQKLTGLKNIESQISRLLKGGYIIISERLNERFRARKETFVTKGPVLRDADLETVFANVKGAPQQEKVLMYVVAYFRKQQARGNAEEIMRKDLMQATGVTSAVIDALAKKNVLTIDKRRVSRFDYVDTPLKGLPELTNPQRDALTSIRDSFKTFNTVLFRGVTSSGKTEIYQHLINEVLSEGNQVLMLVPEIALTTQLTRRMQAVFGDRVLIYHSKFSDNERVEIWQTLLKDHGPRLVIGVRSSVFLPFSNLRLVIVDEEHESSYKQNDPAPRYNGRDVGIVLASMHGAKTLLGSATPSIESYFKATSGKFGLVELLERYGNMPLPSISLVDMTKALKTKTYAGGFSLETLKWLKEDNENHRQSIVFQNRRGFAPVARCKMCAWSPKCNQCDVALTYHKGINSLVCHYCGNVYKLPDVCPQCSEPTVEIHGFGTERIEEEIKERMPQARLSRLDLDTTRNKDSYSKIIDSFSNGESDILVGTQMVTKGLDFGGVNSVVVVNADSLINFPDFRASERAFNLLEQVSGRAGRRENSEGRVIIQTYDVTQKLFQRLMEHDYVAFYHDEIEERRKYLYPPFSKVINIYLKHRDAEVLTRFANSYAELLRRSLGERVLGPKDPLVSRIQNLYIKTIMLKIEPGSSMELVRKYLREVYVYMLQNERSKTFTVYYDVDPV